MKRVLAAVSDVLLADGMSRLLAANDLICDVVHEGLAADQFLREKQVSVVLMEVDLPGLSGFEVLSRLRLRNDDIPVILMSVKEDATEWIRSLELGADDLLRVPFHIDELIQRIEALLRRKNPVAEGLHKRLQCGNLILDDRVKQVYANGLAITLPPKEWAILNFMVCHAGKVVSKQQLIEAIFSSEAPHGPNTIEVHMSRIRPKLAGTNTHIRTIRGYGYLMEVIPGPCFSPLFQPEAKQAPASAK